MPSGLYPADLDGSSAVPCRECGFLVLWGVTKNGKKAPFNERSPHVLHMVTCEARKAAHKRLRAMKPKREKPLHEQVFGKLRSPDVTDEMREELDRRIEQALRKG